jgi:hypothetical protein
MDPVTQHILYPRYSTSATGGIVEQYDGETIAAGIHGSTQTPKLVGKESAQGTLAFNYQGAWPFKVNFAIPVSIAYQIHFPQKKQRKEIISNQRFFHNSLGS